MNTQLTNIASVSHGMTFRGRITPAPRGNTRLIQMKDLGKDNLVHLEEAIYIDRPKIHKDRLVRAGDIIFRSRGLTTTAVLLTSDVANTILSSPLFCIRPDVSLVMPEYLLWWINQPLSQAYFNTQSRGTVLKMVSIQSIQALEVTLPPFAQQKRIAEFVRLAAQEQELLEKIKESKNLYTQGVLQRALMQMASSTK